MTRTILVAGTASHVGKSTVVAGLCRLLADRGVSVAPFKAQNMSNNARAVPVVGESADTRSGDARAGEDARSSGHARASGHAYGEIGVSQYVQARAARVTATTDCNPVLLKPSGDGRSQLVIHGEAVGTFRAGEYFDERWGRARAAAERSWERLAAEYDVVVAEGAGSIAEPNLRHRDLANVETARFADADILLVGDIERGGVFAALAGTLDLMPDDLRERVRGCLITKFRGDESLLDPGIEMFEARYGVPVVGVLPYDDPGLPAEDSVSLPADERTVLGADGDPTPADECVTVAVPRLPRVSNVADLDPLTECPGVRVEVFPPADPFDHADALVLPGTKNTVDDLLALREARFDDRLDRFDGPVVGLCGGYQLLGERLSSVERESADAEGALSGFGLLPVETRFSGEKCVERVERDLRGVGPLAGASGPVSGYEIHTGRTTLTGPADRPFEGEGAAVEGVLGTYLHGLFENPAPREAFLGGLFARAGLDRPAGGTTDSPHDRAAALLRDHADLSVVGY
ncbi:cobyric acid synthase [Halomarina litorea]|uniref:cobyric acid synthase n=1 Tax=Halomarina litorea TaxID=2961595 RepID=UPI0020C1BBFF|nr:cobyric acid synthase [Halomarina sp. BCD28]